MQQPTELQHSCHLSLLFNVFIALFMFTCLYWFISYLHPFCHFLFSSCVTFKCLDLCTYLNSFVVCILCEVYTPVLWPCPNLAHDTRFDYSLFWHSFFHCPVGFVSGFNKKMLSCTSVLIACLSSHNTTELIKCKDKGQKYRDLWVLKSYH